MFLKIIIIFVVIVSNRSHRKQLTVMLVVTVIYI